MSFLQAMWCVARVSHPRLRMPHSPRYTFRLSLNPFSGHPMFCAPVASLGKMTIFRKCVSPIPTTWSTQCSCAFTMSVSMPGKLALHSTSVIFPGDALDLAKASEVKLFKCFQLPSIECPSLTGIEHGNDDICLMHCQFRVYYDDLLSQYSCPQPAEGSTCFSQFV